MPKKINPDATSEVMKFFNLKKKLETPFDIDGRVCTACGEYKSWQSFKGHSRSKTGRTSKCKACYFKERTSKGRDYKREKYCAKKHTEKLKETDPCLVRSRSIRSSLMRRARERGMDRSEIPTAEEVKNWLNSQKPLTCYYSGVSVGLFRCHIDHKIPLGRGGSNSLDNLCVCDAKINSAKGAMTEQEFKSLYKLISTWEDKGDYLLSRLRMGHFGKLK